MSFDLFDPQADFRVVRNGKLPHWYQPGVTCFVTFRTDDSMPREAANLWRRRRDDWLRRHHISPAIPKWRAKLRELPEAQQAEFHSTFTREYEEHLDRGHGECALRRPELAKRVANCLRHFDGIRYKLGDFVVMPNHVHLLVCLSGDTDIESQCTSWKKYSAIQINRALGRKGRFWQEESFDHLVRSPEQFDRLRRYIADNPVKAALQSGEYVHYRCPESYAQSCVPSAALTSSLPRSNGKPQCVPRNRRAIDFDCALGNTRSSFPSV
jgi:type I restriction enzyme R subunit